MPDPDEVLGARDEGRTSTQPRRVKKYSDIRGMELYGEPNPGADGSLAREASRRWIEQARRILERQKR
jgi:hypothetical protein